MNPRTLGAAKVTGSLAALATAGLLAWKLLPGAMRVGEEGARTYFYDQSEKRLYDVARDTVPPDVGIGGEPDDGVRAVVVAWRADRENRNKHRIAYLETYTPDLARVLRDVQAARVAHHPPAIRPPEGDSPFVLKNTLVRREHDTAWFDMTTPEARKIVSEWQNERDSSGQPPVVCTP